MTEKRDERDVEEKADAAIEETAETDAEALDVDEVDEKATRDDDATEKPAKRRRARKRVRDDTDLPLFKFDDDSSSAAQKRLRIGALALVVVCVLFYMMGISSGNQVLILVAFIVAIIGAAIGFAVQKRIRAAMAPVDQAKIDEQVEQYKVDLVDTFNGYDVDYTTADILSAADAYRSRLEQENASITDLDATSFVSVLRKMFQESRDGSAKRKKERKQDKAFKQEQKKARKEARKSKGKANKSKSA